MSNRCFAGWAAVAFLTGNALLAQAHDSWNVPAGNWSNLANGATTSGSIGHDGACVGYLDAGAITDDGGTIRVEEMRCEYLFNPLGIDETAPRLSWTLHSEGRDQRQTAYQVMVASSSDRLAQDRGDLWDSGKVASDETAQVAYAGKPLGSRQACFWKVRVWDRDGQPSQWSQPARWEMGLLKADDWKAHWITGAQNAADGAPAAPVPILRKTIHLSDKPVASASLFATALGLYEMRINGHRVGDHVFAPEWTDYKKRVRYQVYDVAPLLKPGDNAIAALLGDGWYCGHIGLGGFHQYGKHPALLAQLEVTYADGSVERVVTDSTWKVHPSPLMSSDIMLGESYDARQELPGWDEAAFNDAAWAAATAREEAPRPLESQVMEPVRQTGELLPKSFREVKPGVWIFDLGQNMVGVARLKVSAPAGTKLTLRHAEVLNPDGSIYVDNLRAAPATDTYLCKGTGVEVWQPRFTFHGFRFVELTGLPGKPDKDTVTGVVIGSDTPRNGHFKCSDPRINQLQSNIQWGQRGNFLSVPTDCPQRDERLGWMGDAQVFMRTATFNADVAAFFTKWLVDVDDAQSPDGAFSDVSPNTFSGGRVPAWADAGVICPWTMYQIYGDRRILQRHLPAMTRWVEWCRTHSTDLIRDKDRGNDYGDWLSIGAKTPKDVIGTAFFAYSTNLLAKSYEAVGEKQEAATYRRLFDDICAAFNRRYVAKDGVIHGDTQCCYAMALKFDLLPEVLRPEAARRLEAGIQANGGRLNTGFVGVSYLLPVLTKAEKIDTAYRLMMQDAFPSWLFSVKHGATTIWERWDGWTPDKGFQDPGMNSFNHYALGSCGEWFYGSVAGIDVDPEKPAFRHIVVHPRIGGGLTSASASVHSIRGPIAVAWAVAEQASGHVLTLHVTIPANTTATVYVPAEDAASVVEGSVPAARAAGVRQVHMQGTEAVLEVGSGAYVFKSKIPS